MALTVYQRKVLDLLISKAVKGVAKATLAELTAYVGSSSQTSARHYIATLEKKGYIETIRPDKMCDGNSYRILKTK